MESLPGNVIPLRYPEVINGAIEPLGVMTLPELEALQADCTVRLEDARTDLMVVRDFIERRFPDTGARGE